MCDDERHWSFPFAFYMQKMNLDPIDFCYIIGVLINFGFDFSPVKFHQPTIGQLFYVRQAGAILPARTCDFIRPSRLTYSEFQVVYSGLCYLAFKFSYHWLFIWELIALSYSLLFRIKHIENISKLSGWYLHLHPDAGLKCTSSLVWRVCFPELYPEGFWQ